MAERLTERAAEPRLSEDPELRHRRVDSAHLLLAFLLLVAQAVVLATWSSAHKDTSPIPSWLFDLPFVVGALACLRRARRAGASALAWRIQGVALVCFLAGNLYAIHFVPDFDTYPTPADAFWLAAPLASAVAVLLQARSRVAEVLPASLLDGLIVGLATAAATGATLLGPLLTLGSGRWSVVATNLAYPVADLVVLGVLAGAVQAIPSSGPAWPLLALGTVLVVVGDISYLLGVAEGTWVPNGLPDLLWPSWATAVGIAATLDRPGSALAPANPRHRVPVAAAVVCVGVLVFGQGRDLPVAVVVLALAGIVAVAARTAVGLRQVHRVGPLRRLLLSDAVTELPNRQHLVERLTAAMHDPDGPTSLLVVDLERFRDVNHALGHDAGDALLRKVGRRLLEAVGSGRVVTRLGSDDFGVLLVDTDEAAALEVAGQVQAGLNLRPFRLHGQTVVVRARVGVATTSSQAGTAGEVLAEAEFAVHQARQAPRGIAVGAPGGRGSGAERLRLQSQLRRAFERGEVVGYFQPQIHLSTGRVAGVEVLARWHHPTRGLLAPGDFLGAVAECGLDQTLTRTMLDQAGRAVLRCRRATGSVKVSVNVSARDLDGGSLATDVASTMRRASIPAGGLTLEITEDTVLGNLDGARAALSDLRDLGVRVSLDDYGTGLASLSYLRDLPVDELKLDRSFVQRAPGDERDAVIARSTVELAHHLDLSAVAEGVETAETAAWLREIGFDLGQGWHHARPMPLDALVAWIAPRALSPA